MSEIHKNEVIFGLYSACFLRLKPHLQKQHLSRWGVGAALAAKNTAFRRGALAAYLFVFWFNATGEISRSLVPTWSMGTGDTIAECQYHLPIQQNCLKMRITLNKKMSDVIPILAKR